jgi:hypothetical protein
MKCHTAISKDIWLHVHLSNILASHAATLSSTCLQAAGGLMPWILERFLGWHIGDNHSLAKMFSQEQKYSYENNNNTYAFCPKNARVFSYGKQQQ